MNRYGPHTHDEPDLQGGAMKPKQRKARKLPSLKTVWELIRWLLSTREGYKALTIAILACLVLLLGLYWTGYAVQLSSPYIIRTVESTQAGALARGIEAGIRNRKAYIIETAMMSVRIDDELPTNGKTLRHIDERISYTLRPLKDINSAKMKVFHEHYHFPDAKTVSHWPGSEEERDIVGGMGNPFVTSNVLFDATRGVNYTLVTGVDARVELPLKDRITHTVHLGALEDGQFYPNEDDDIICELLIVIESPKTPLKPVDAVKIVGGRMQNTEHFQIKASATSEGGAVLSARFEDVEPGDIVGLVYSWQ